MENRRFSFPLPTVEHSEVLLDTSSIVEMHDEKTIPEVNRYAVRTLNSRKLIGADESFHSICALSSKNPPSRMEEVVCQNVSEYLFLKEYRDLVKQATVEQMISVHTKIMTEVGKKMSIVCGKNKKK